MFKNIKKIVTSDFLWIYITLILFVVYVFFILCNNEPTVYQMQNANLTFQIVNGDFFLKSYNLEEFSSIYSNFLFYILPVKIFGDTTKAIICAAFLIIISSVFSAVLLIKDNIRTLQTKELIMFLCLVGLCSVPFVQIGSDGAFLPFVFLSLFFMNRFIQTEKFYYLVFFVLFASFFVFGKIVSVVLFIIPLIVYSLLSIFYKEHPKKSCKVLISTLIACALGLFAYYLYIKFNNNTGLYSAISNNFYTDFYNGNIMIETLWHKFVRSLFIVQNCFFFGQPIISKEVFIYIYRIFVTIVGILLTIKISVSTIFGKFKSDFVSFILSISFMLFFIFVFAINTDSFDFLEKSFVFFPFLFAIVIIRYKNLLNLLDNFQYWTLICIQLLIYSLYAYNVFIPKLI